MEFMRKEVRKEGKGGTGKGKGKGKGEERIVVSGFDQFFLGMFGVLEMSLFWIYVLCDWE